MRIFILICLVWKWKVLAEQKRYDGYKLIQVVPKTIYELSALKALQVTDAQIDFWKEPSIVGKFVDIMVDGTKQFKELRNYLQEYGLNFKVLHQNVQQLFDNEQRTIHLFRENTGGITLDFPIDQYHSHAEINQWLDQLASTYSNIANTLNIGKSFEGRDMKVMKIGAPSAGIGAKKALWLDSNIHAREWVAGATGIYIINELVTKYNKNSDYKNLVDKIDFYILPIANPDGYEYSRSKDRMWRKTRGGPYCKTNWFGQKKCCYGADPNRNYDFHWGEASTSSDPCNYQQIYCGPEPASEIETKNIESFLNKSTFLNSYISLHSYSDDWMYPFGYKAKTYPADIEKLRTLSKAAYNAIKSVHGVEYEVGSPPDILYAASGSSMDYANAVSHIDLAFTLELRPGPTDPDKDQSYGFALPPQYIIPTASEAWAGIKTVAEYLAQE